MSGFLYPPESGYNLDPEEEVHPEKPQMYMSMFRPTVVLENKSTKDARRTMGPAKVEVSPPENYLKKHSKQPKIPEKTQCSRELRSCCSVRKPAVPARTDNPLMGTHTKKDFIKTVTVVPRKPQPTSVDTRKGHRQPLENSGLVPKYIMKKHYGEVPEYLQQRNEEERRAQEEYEHFLKEQRKQGAMKQLSAEERRDVLEGLKQSWDKLHQEYQCLPLVTDQSNLSKKSHKERLEASMKQLENDMKRIERFQTIYISNRM